MTTIFEEYEERQPSRIPPWLVGLFKKVGYVVAYIFGAWLVYLFVCLIMLNFFTELALSLPIQVFWGIPQVMGAETWAEAHPIWTNPWFP